MLYYLAIFFVAVSHEVLPVVNAGYVFEVLLVKYQNPTHITSTRGHKCDPGHRTDPCDNAFVVCISETGSSDCGIGRFETVRIAENNDNLVFSEGQSVGGIDNPLTITSNEIWQGINIIIDVYDIDGQILHIVNRNSDFITKFEVNPNVVSSPEGAFTNESHYDTNVADLWLAFRLTCTYPHHGPNCSQYQSSRTITPSSALRVNPSTSALIVIDPKHYTTTTSSSASASSTSIPRVVVVQGASDGKSVGNDTLPLILTIVIIAIVIILFAVLSIALALVLVKCRAKRKRKQISSHRYDDSAFRFPDNLDTQKEKIEEHVYEKVKDSWHQNSKKQNISPPTYAAINPTYSTTEEPLKEDDDDDDDNMVFEKNVAYASVDIQRSGAYVALERDPGDRPMLPLPPAV